MNSRNNILNRINKRRRSNFLAALSVEYLEARQMLYGVTDTPHGSGPSHDLGDTISAEVFMYVNGGLVDLPANLGVTGGTNTSFVHTSAAGSTISISPADINADTVIDTPTSYTSLDDVFSTWRNNAGDAGNNTSATFSESELLGNATDATNTVRMYVNGTPVHSYEGYEIHNNDRIVLDFGSASIVGLDTAQGTMLLEMLPNVAPSSVTNFLNYVSDGDYNSSIIHRSIPSFIVQGGGFATPSTTLNSVNDLTSIPTDAAVVNEFSVSNTRGTVAMAKLSGDPNSATSQWFVNLVDNSSNLDNQNGGFTVFAQVLDMSVPDAIAAIDRQNLGGAFTDLPVAPGNQLVVIGEAFGDGVVSGRVYVDEDLNGIFDAGEQTLQGVTVYSDTDGDDVLDVDEFSVLTAADGTYLFHLPNGSHQLKQIVAAPFKQTTPAANAAISFDLAVGQTVADQLFINRVVEPPVSIDLAAVSDSGVVDDDNSTANNNSSLATNLSFDVTGVEDGALVRLFAGTQEIASGVATGNSVNITTAGNLVLADGPISITATQIFEGVESLASVALDITIDSAVGVFESAFPATLPLATNFSFDVDNTEEASTGFSYSLAASVSGMSINATSGQFTWRPIANQLGANSFTVRATDAAGNTRDLVSSMTVTGEASVQYSVEATDLQGNSITELTVGDSFILRLLTADVRATPRGVFSGYADIVWQDELVTAVGPLTYGSQYPNVHTGDFSNINLIDEAGATAGFTELGGGQFLIFSLPMTASNAGALTLSVDPADNSPHTDTLLFGVNESINPEQIIYDSLQLQINLGFSPGDDIFNFDEDSTNVSLNVLTNDGDTDPATLIISDVSTPSQSGTVTIAADGKSLIYSPAADFFGEEVFTYTAGNNTGDASATVTIQVFPIQDLPTANDDVITTVTEDSSNVALDLLINDTIAPDANESLSIVFITQGTQGGTVAVSDSGEFVLYTPAVNFDGTDTFTYTIRDSNGGEDTATVTVDLQAAADVPTAGDDAFPVDEDVVDFPLDVIDNDSSNAVGGGNVLVVAVGTPDQGGVVSIAVDGLSVLYSPAPDFFGTETFSYTINDEGGLSAQATVTMTVGNIADSPQANDDAFTVVVDSPGDELDVLANDTHLPDPTELLTITSVTTSSEGGTINIINSGSSLTYAPPTGFSGQDAFSYTITDEDGLTDEAVVTISIFDYIPGGLAGLVYIDADGDGVQDANELVLGGIKIHLTGTTSGGESIDLEMLTSEQGLYEFTDLEAGSYTVTQTQPSFLVDGGFQGAAPNITFSSNSYSVELAEGQEISDGDFTEKGREASTLTLFDFFNRPAPPTLIGSFGDTVEDQWIAAHPAWVAFQDTSVVWDGGSHTLVVDVVRDDASTDYGVLSTEAGDGIRQVTDEADTAVIFVTGLPDTYGIEPQGSDDGGDGVPESEKVPDFSLEDVNTTSSLLGTDVSPRDYDGNVTAFYFGLATCSYCTAQFGHLNTMQNDFDSNDPDLGIEIVGINLAGRESGNASITAGNDIPWLQDVDLDENGEADAWEDWGAQLRDVIIVDAQNRQVSKINLTPNDLGDTAIYTLVRTMITDAIAAESEAEAELPEASVTAVQDAIDTIAEAHNSQLTETVTAHDLALSSWF